MRLYKSSSNIRYYESGAKMNNEQETKYEDYVMIRTDSKSQLSVWMKLPPQGR